MNVAQKRSGSHRLSHDTFCSYALNTAIDVAVLHNACLFLQDQRRHDKAHMKDVNEKKADKKEAEEYTAEEINRDSEDHKALMALQKKDEMVKVLGIVEKKMKTVTVET